MVWTRVDSKTKCRQIKKKYRNFYNLENYFYPLDMWLGNFAMVEVKYVSEGLVLAAFCILIFFSEAL